MAKILQIGMIPHNMTLFKSICVQYQFHRQTLPFMKIDQGQIQFREYVSTGTEPNVVLIGSFACRARIDWCLAEFIVRYY